jgi:hypothetical protein
MARRSGPAKGEPFSVRLSRTTDLAVEAEARRVRRSKGAVVESLAEEAMRARRFPGIAFRGDDAERRPWVIGSGLDVWEICQMSDEFTEVAEIVAATQLTEPQVHLALAYRRAFPDEIAAAIEENTRGVEDWQRLYPFVRSRSSAGA